MVYQRIVGEGHFQIPLAADVAILAVFLVLTPSVSASWFLFLFVVFALATRGSTRAMLGLVSAASVAIILRVAATEPFSWRGLWRWLSIGLGTLVSGLGMGFLGARERDHLERRQFLEKLTQLLQFDRGLTESIRQTLGELILEFGCEQACLAIRDDELERIFVWKVRAAEREPTGPETLSPSRSDTFLADAFEVSLCWEYKDGKNGGFGWDRRTGHRVKKMCIRDRNMVFRLARGVSAIQRY